MIQMGSDLLHLLVIEDRSTYLPTIKKRLSSLKNPRFQVSHVHSYEAALEFMIHHIPDVILADGRLGQSGTVQTFLNICLKDPSLPLIILTDEADRSRVETIFQSVAEDYLLESDLIGPVGDRIQQVIRRHKDVFSTQQSDQRFRDLADSAPVMIWETNGEGQNVFFNKTWLDFRGNDIETERRARRKDEIHADDVEMYQSITESSMQKRQCFRLEYRIKARDRSYRWILDTGSPMYDATGMFRGFVGSAIDITERRNAEADKEAWQLRYQAAVEASRQLLLDWNPNTQEVTFGGNLEQILGYTAADLGMQLSRWLDRIHEDDRESFYHMMRSIRETEQAARMEYRIQHKDGQWITVEHEAQVILSPGGGIAGIVGFVNDISIKKRTMLELRARERRYRTLVANIPGAVYRYQYQQGPGWKVDFMSKQIQKICGYPRSYFINGDLEAFTRMLLHDDRGVREKALADATQSRGPFFVTYRIRHHDGQIRWIQEQGRVVEDRATGTIWLDGLIFDISDQAKAEERLNFISHHDLLTGLPNRTLFLDRLGQALIAANHERDVLGVFFLDLDHFKRINDTLGHTVGDKLIQMSAGRLKHILYETDTVTRLGGDEFAILIPSLQKPAHALKIADKISNAFKTPFFIDGHELFMSISTGISLYPNDGFDADALMKNADTAMNRAKEQGRGNYQLYSPQMNDKALLRLKLENRLRRALERDEFRLHYQPQIDFVTGRITGMEALLRWHHPEFGLVSPAEFVPLAEEAGLIVPIGAWVLETACNQIKEWQLMGYTALRMAVNLSSRQLRRPDLAATISSIVRNVGVDPSLVELELTEGTLMDDIEQTASALVKLRDQGLRIAIDDFGTGYSSLSTLKRFPLSTLKIDRSFVCDIPGDIESGAIAEAIISMGHSMKLEVVAEGVEQQQQFDFLKARSCDRMQGFLFSRAIPATAFTELLKVK
jgi:diguanylate cyclase (GGDEF)-like protein/PAS domain S-box-containing protein